MSSMDRHHFEILSYDSYILDDFLVQGYMIYSSQHNCFILNLDLEFQLKSPFLP